MNLTASRMYAIVSREVVKLLIATLNNGAIRLVQSGVNLTV
jgi:hypothetical protein